MKKELKPSDKITIKVTVAEYYLLKRMRKNKK